MAGSFLSALGLLLAAPHPWTPAPDAPSLEARVAPPPGYRRVDLPAGSFGAWLRALPTRPGRGTVRLHDGREKGNQAAHHLVFDIDVGSRDLQQCADAAMRLRAEYLRAAGREEDICFRYTSGDAIPWRRWAAGERPRVRGNRVRWEAGAPASRSYREFRRYLDAIFTYAGSKSLSGELHAGVELSRVAPGDVFIQGGFPGHAVLVMDAAEDDRGRRVYLLAQSYMPAQEIHLLDNPAADGPWYDAQAKGRVVTPEWTFEPSDLRRFDERGCPVHN